MRVIEELCALLESDGTEWTMDDGGRVWWRRYDGVAFAATEVEGRGLTLKAMYVEPEEAMLMYDVRMMHETWLDMRESYLYMVDAYECARGIEIEGCSPDPDADTAELEAECDALVAKVGRVRA